MKHQAKAQKHLEKLAKILDLPDFAERDEMIVKTFEEFLTEEPVVKQLIKHYIDVYKRNTAPHPARARRMETQHHVDQYRLHRSISQDLSVPEGKRRKAADKIKSGAPRRPKARPMTCRTAKSSATCEPDTERI